ncbi:DeoR/GlpR family DNA-binding transcription regulator [Flavobacterium limi]|uniref:DeoR family transcriptional regulator n=1 Tax=Flavobacterium limi TaxID=2045105 RepID=A0ABQ1UZ12_9FLAO|nr:DeoR/GlpR family DNA-binding transcription regulator [Flavobacterium limi]GGF28744.1 DeoR family transcriptional regulator [Flavobacterium limi]
MLKEERFGKILDILQKNGRIQYDNTASALKVSEDTIRRDIEVLHNNGLLSKVRGGAIPITKNPLTFTDRAAFKTDKKELIALKAQQFISDGDSIFMDAGTTNCSIVSKLPVDINLTIITNNIALAPVLHKHKNVKLVVLGGSYNQQTQATEGVKACEEISRYAADTYFMGTCAIDSEIGVTATFIGDADIKTSMHKHAKKTVALAIEGKLNMSETYRICPIKEVAVLITELASSDEKLNNYRNKETKIV